MYADDTELHYSNGELQDELVKVSDWMTVMNIGKLVCMLIGTGQRLGGKSLYLSLNNSVLKQVSSTKYLGLYKILINLARSCRLHFKKSEGENLFH